MERFAAGRPRQIDGPPRLLHVHGSFSLGGKEARAVRLMNLWGDRARHSIVSAAPQLMSARDAIDPATPVDFPQPPPLAGRPGLRRFRAIAAFLSDYDLILSYNWGAMDAVMARRIHGGPPLIHHEDGFNADEAGGLKPQRNLYRRLALQRAHALVVPSVRLDGIAREVWRQPPRKVHLIRNGIDTARYALPPVPDAIPALNRTAGKLLVGTVAGLRPVKNIRRLVRAVAPHRDRLQLVVVGEGPERDAIAAEARDHGLADICMAGFLPEPWRFMGLFDIFALSSDSEQFPISLVEAMAAGLPVASTDVGDVAAMVAPENRPFVVPDEAALSSALGALAGDPGLRQRLGEANRQRACRDFTEAAMVDAYAGLYGQALSSPHILR
ncbi:glycosyl transferase family 1 [Sphingobium sp. 22B]|uniref:glycosyltransferase family 4 protein n=1 Tax=unclassified Sphingobium TaxID=2611147 RepID=UPI00078101E8|nr:MULTISPECIES: glycosyltransferase family 4 protein [unclassified Sphingobium]KXU32119.1 glycosyl transferase family 1 [Sphingobium sp. AM]KYC31873.1 glycosyl transferase family 1 [Sphingobium sp. 22B]OAP31442.1 glycosyl transferase family 1 [Sphingobium sp. 20006FA]